MQVHAAKVSEMRKVHILLVTCLTGYEILMQRAKADLPIIRRKADSRLTTQLRTFATGAITALGAVSLIATCLRLAEIPPTQAPVQAMRF